VDHSETTTQATPAAAAERFAKLAEALAPFPVETCDAREPLYDYTLRPYPAAAERAGRLRSTMLLYQLLGGSARKKAWQQLIYDLRRRLGVHRTIWGVKLIEGRLSVELYFYFRTLSAARTHRESPDEIPTPITFAEVAAALAPTLRIVPAFPAHVPAIMVSVDVNDEVLARGTVEELHVYLQSGLSWDVRTEGIEHANHYTFFEMSEVDRLRALIEHQANGLIHASACGVEIQKLLLPRLYNCRTLCLAAKRKADGIYFAGIDTQQLQWFMERFAWPAETGAFLATRADDFAHLRWDVGLDLVAAEEGFRWVKAGVYGTL
jgi:hypothetical protein